MIVIKIKFPTHYAPVMPEKDDQSLCMNLQIAALFKGMRNFELGYFGKNI
jgi:hypothetical protein